MKEVKNQKLSNIELVSQESRNFSIWFIIGFQQRDRQDSQNLNNDTFFKLPVTTAHCNNGTENYSDAGILLIFDIDDYSQSYGQIRADFRALTKDEIIQP